MSEPAEDTPKSYASGGYTGTGTKFAEPTPGHYIPGERVGIVPESTWRILEAQSSRRDV